MTAIRPTLRLLSDEMVDTIISQAMEVLDRKGVFMENREAFGMLVDAGGRPDEGDRVVHIPPELVEKALVTAPSRVRVYDLNGEPALDLGDDRVHFDPGSAAITILDGRTGRIRKPSSQDAVDFARLTNALPHFHAQSTGVVPADVPEGLADRYRLYLALNNGVKPVVTGTFEVEAFAPMKEMLAVVRGGESELHEKPLAIFDACPSPPLRWSNLTCQSVIDAARAGIPSEFVSMPMTGATSSVTLMGTVAQHTAEDLSGVVIAQLAAKGAPVIYGGSPSAFDMRQGTTPMGAIETMMIDAAYAQVGKRLGLPVHAYMGLSDAKALDTQAGLESGMGALLAALAGVNMVSGPGMLDYESCQSLEKLVVDNEICGMAHRLLAGIERREERLLGDLMEEPFDNPRFLSRSSTLQWFRQEQFFPGPVIERAPLGEWERTGRKGLLERARQEVERHLEAQAADGWRLPPDKCTELNRIIRLEAGRFGLDRLPVAF